MTDLCDYSLREHNTFGIDAKCSRFLEYTTDDEAHQIAQILSASHQPYIIIGGGSNLLLTRDFEGIVVHSAIMGYEIDGSTMRCGSGMLWDDVVSVSLNHGLYGGENLSIIPGDVGASAVQNIGAYGVEVKDLIVGVEAVGPCGDAGMAREGMMVPVVAHLSIAFGRSFDIVGLKGEDSTIHQGRTVLQHDEAFLQGGLEQEELRPDLGDGAPAHVDALLQERQAPFLHVELGQDRDLLVDVDIEIAAAVVQHRDQLLQDPEFVVRDDEPGVLHS